MVSRLPSSVVLALTSGGRLGVVVAAAAVVFVVVVAVVLESFGVDVVTFTGEAVTATWEGAIVHGQLTLFPQVHDITIDLPFA